jgi:hypothetical protein
VIGFRLFLLEVGFADRLDGWYERRQSDDFMVSDLKSEMGKAE